MPNNAEYAFSRELEIPEQVDQNTRLPDGYCISEFLEDLSYYEVDNPYIGGGVLWCFADDSFIEGMGK